MGYTKIYEMKADQLVWNMDTGRCHFVTKSGEYTHVDEVDPYPAYPHDFELAGKELQKCAKNFPLSGDVDLYVFSREQVRRSNAFCTCSNLYNYVHKTEEQRIRGWQATIVLSGKRIPIHPAMTRYLMAHEYGHAVAHHLARARKLDMPQGIFYREYSDLRGCNHYEGDRGGEWHVSTPEIFANDFRILVMGVEDEFWPHPQCEYPRALPRLAEYWQNALRDAQKETDDGRASLTPAT